MYHFRAGSKGVRLSNRQHRLFLASIMLLSIGLPTFWREAVGSGIPLDASSPLAPAARSTILAQTPAPATPTSDRITRPTLRLGSQGEAVSELQAMLKLLGFYPDSVTGQFQESTQNAVKQFQSAAGLTPDGVVGSATWSELLPTPPNEANPPTASSPSGPASSTPASGPAPTTPSASSSPTPPAGPGASTTPNTSSGSASANRPSPPNSASTGQPVLRPGMEGAAVTRLQERLKALGFYRGAVDGVFGSQTEQAVKQAQRHYNLEPDGIVGPATWDAILP